MDNVYCILLDDVMDIEVGICMIDAAVIQHEHEVMKVSYLDPSQAVAP